MEHQPIATLPSTAMTPSSLHLLSINKSQPLVHASGSTSLSTTHYLAVANHENGNSYNVNSIIYRLDSIAALGLQLIESHGNTMYCLALLYIIYLFLFFTSIPLFYIMDLSWYPSRVRIVSFVVFEAPKFVTTLLSDWSFYHART